MSTHNHLDDSVSGLNYEVKIPKNKKKVKPVKSIKEDLHYEKIHPSKEIIEE